MNPPYTVPHAPLRFQIHFAFENLFQTYLGLGCLFVSAPSHEGWKVVVPPRHWLRSWQFELFYGKVGKRDRAQHESFNRLSREKKPHLTHFDLLWDAYAPVLDKGACVGYLVSGSFAKKDLQPSELRRGWKEITGSEGSDLNPDFARYVRATLAAPVFDEKAEKSFLRVMELMGRWIGGEARPSFITEVERLHREVFAAVQPHPQWVEWMVGLDKFNRRRESSNLIEPWVQAEMGLTRVPTVVAALMPKPEGIRPGIVESLCRTKAFQRECFLSARRLPESVSTVLGDYGSIVLTSAEPGASRSQARLELRERIQELRDHLEKRIGVPVLAGVGSFSPGGLELARSYREAVTGLHLALEGGRNPFFVEATAGERTAPPHAGLRIVMRQLAEAFTRGASAKISVTREIFIRQVMFASLGQADQVRTHLSAALQMLLDHFEMKSGVALREARALGDEWSSRLMEAQTPPDMVVVFGSALETLSRYQERPREADAAARIEGVVKDLCAAPGHAWNLKALCRRTGMSTPTFLKWFHKVTGSAFGPYLRKLRLDRAREMLSEGNLTLERVAQECGFSSAGSFITFFRKASGMSPKQFRRQTKD